jgi:hypothetical protein
MICSYITDVIVSYFNIFSVTWCVIHSDNGDIIAKTCGRLRNCAVIYTVCACVGFVNNKFLMFINIVRYWELLIMNSLRNVAVSVLDLSHCVSVVY